MQDLLGMNWNLFEFFNQPAGHQPLLDRLMIFAANDLIFLAPALLLALWICFAARMPTWRYTHPAARDGVAGDRALGQRMVLLWVFAVVVALALNVLLGHLIFEPRPFVSHPTIVHLLIAHAADAAFPSDHEAVVASIAAMLVIGALQIRHRERRLAVMPSTAPARARTWPGRVAMLIAVLAVLAAALIGVARIYVGVHYPGDILGGAACGTIGALAAATLRPLFEPILATVVGVAGRLGLA